MNEGVLQGSIGIVDADLVIVIGRDSFLLFHGQDESDDQGLLLKHIHEYGLLAEIIGGVEREVDRSRLIDVLQFGLKLLEHGGNENDFLLNIVLGQLSLEELIEDFHVELEEFFLIGNELLEFLGRRLIDGQEKLGTPEFQSQSAEMDLDFSFGEDLDLVEVLLILKGVQVVADVGDGVLDGGFEQLQGELVRED